MAESKVKPEETNVVSPPVNTESQGRGQVTSPLAPVQIVLESLLGPLPLTTPEERAFSLAIELNDGRVAGVALARILACQGSVIPLSVTGLWLQVGMALRSGNELATEALLGQIVDYSR